MLFFKKVLDHKLFVHYIGVIIAILGFMSAFKMQREARPNVNFNRVAIAVAYPGASPSDVEELTIEPIEEKIAEVDGVEEFRSVSYSGAGTISVQIDDDYPNIQLVTDEIRRKVLEVKNLPSEVDDPVVTEIKAVNVPVLRMAVFGDLDPFSTKIELEKLKAFLQKQPGVQSVDYTGLQDLQLKILSSPEKLNQYDLTLMEIMASLSSWAKQKPGGLLENAKSTANITIGKDYSDKEQLQNFVIRSNQSLKGVKLSDVAEVKYSTRRQQERTLFASQPANLVTITKKPFADIVKTVDQVKLALEDYKPNIHPQLQYKLYTDESTKVRNRLSIVISNAVFGLFLVLFILIVFLDWRSALVTSLGIPIAILGGVTLIYFSGVTMNSLVLVGMIIVLGMLVDDAIVVCENIFSYVEKGMTSREAALLGVSEIATPVVATVLTTVFAFFPILFMKGIMGQFLSVVPLTVIAMLVVSLFEALVILPVHCEEIMRKRKEKTSIFLPLEKIYRSYLEWSLRRRWLIVLVVVIFTGLSVGQGKSLFQKFTLFPAEGLEGLNIRVELPQNSPLDQTEDIIKDLSQRVSTVSQESFESLYSTIGNITTGGVSGSRQSGSHLGQISIVFVSEQEFYSKEKQIVEDIRRVAREFSQEKSVQTSVTIKRPGPPVGKPIQWEVTSRDIVKSQAIVAKLKEKFAGIEGVHSLVSDLDGNSKKYRFLIDNSFAVAEGISPADISRTIFAASSGVVTSEILKNNEKVEILVGLQGADAQGLEIADIKKLKVLNKNRLPVPIRSFVKVVEEKEASSIQRLDGVKTVTLFGEVDDKIISGKEANQKVKALVLRLKKEYPTAKISAGGSEKSRMETLADTGRLYILALLLIFMVISLSFNSMIYPFLVLLSIPMGLLGVIWALSLHGKPLSLMAMIGVVGLSGVVVNVSIILLKFIQEKIAAGMEPRQAIVEGGVRRLRPIIITTLTTLIGLIPAIYGIGGIDTFVQPLALVLGWGLFVATLLTLFALPALVSFIPLARFSKQ